MATYELNYLVTGKAEKPLEEIGAEIEALVKKVGGQIAHKISPRRRELAYPIAKVGVVYAGSFVFEADSATARTLFSELNLHPSVIRFLLLGVPSGFRAGTEERRVFRTQGFHGGLQTDVRRSGRITTVRSGAVREGSTDGGSGFERARESVSDESLNQKLAEILKD